MKHPNVSAAKLLPAVLVLIPALSGCEGGKSGFAVSGRLVQDGKPFSAADAQLPPGSRPIQIVFYLVPGAGGAASPASAAGEAFHSEVNADTGEFTVKGPSGKGIPAGKYRIAVTVLTAAGGGPVKGMPPGPGGAAAPPGMLGMGDKLKGAFSKERSRLEVEITRPEQLVIDVGSKPGVSVQ